MRSVAVIIGLLSVLPLLCLCGCQHAGPAKPVVIDQNSPPPVIYGAYAPQTVDLLPLTRIVKVKDSDQYKLRAYVAMLDQFGSQVKSPGVFRFELYEHLQRSADPRGRRLVLWPDIDLTQPAENNTYWRDFLRAYEFTLPIESRAAAGYVLEVTVLTPNSRRLISKILLLQP